MMRVHLLTALFMAALARPAWADDQKVEKPAGEPKGPGDGKKGSPQRPKVPPGPPIHPLTAHYGDGFNLVSGDGEFWLNIGLEARVQATVFDTKSIDEVRAPPPTRLTLAPRSVHLFLRGRIFGNVEFGLGMGLAGEPQREFDLGQVSLAYATYYAAEWLQIQLGQIIVPFGLEMSSYFYPTRTIERSIAAENIAPYRDVGLVISGRVLGGLSYHVGAISGTPPNVSNNEPGTFSLFAADEQIDFIARLSYSLEQFGIGISFEVGGQPFLLSGARSLFITRSQPATLFDATTRGLRFRGGADLKLKFGPFGFRAEGLYEQAKRSDTLNELGGVTEDGTEDGSDVVRFGAYAEAGVFVFGSEKEGGLEPVVKYEVFGAESKGEPAPLNPVRVHAFTGGLTYYFEPNVRLQVDAIVVDVRRYGTVEDPDPAPASYLDNRLSWLVLSQFQVWFL